MVSGFGGAEDPWRPKRNFMNQKKLISLALGLALTLLYIFVVEKPGREEKLVAGKVFNGTARQSIASIEITNAKGSYTLTNSKAAPSGVKDEVLGDSDIGSWGFSDLPSAYLDPAALNSLLTSLVEFDTPDILDSKDLDPDLSVYGLKAPLAKVSLKVGDASSLLEFGSRNEYVGRRYVRINGEKVGLGGEGLFSILGKQRNDYRSRSPIQFQDSEVAELAITLKSGGKFNIASAGPGQWKLAAPVRATCSNEAVSNLTRQLRGVAVSDFLDTAQPTDSDANLASPDAVFSITFKDGKKEPLEIKASALAAEQGKNPAEIGAYFSVSGRPGALKTSQDLVSFGRLEVEKLREKKLFNFAIDEAVGVRFEGGSKTPTSLTLDGDVWRVNGKDADLIFIREYLRTLADTAAIGFPEKATEFGFGKPSAKVVVLRSRQGASSSRELVIGAQTQYLGKTAYFAAVDGQEEPFIISEESFKKLAPKEEVLLKTGGPSPQPSIAP